MIRGKQWRKQETQPEVPGYHYVRYKHGTPHQLPDNTWAYGPGPVIIMRVTFWKNGKFYVNNENGRRIQPSELIWYGPVDECEGEL